MLLYSYRISDERDTDGDGGDFDNKKEAFDRVSHDLCVDCYKAVMERLAQAFHPIMEDGDKERVEGA